MTQSGHAVSKLKQEMLQEFLDLNLPIILAYAERNDLSPVQNLVSAYLTKVRQNAKQEEHLIGIIDTIKEKGTKKEQASIKDRIQETKSLITTRGHGANVLEWVKLYIGTRHGPDAGYEYKKVEKYNTEKMCEYIQQNVCREEVQVTVMRAMKGTLCNTNRSPALLKAIRMTMDHNIAPRQEQ